MIIDELEKLLKDATPGPWEINNDLLHSPYGEARLFPLHMRKDFEFFCLLRNNAEKLLAVVKAARKVCKACAYHDHRGYFKYCENEYLFTTLKNLDTSPPTPEISDQP